MGGDEGGLAKTGLGEEAREETAGGSGEGSRDIRGGDEKT